MLKDFSYNDIYFHDICSNYICSNYIYTKDFYSNDISSTDMGLTEICSKTCDIPTRITSFKLIASFLQFFELSVFLPPLHDWLLSSCKPLNYLHRVHVGSRGVLDALTWHHYYLNGHTATLEVVTKHTKNDYFRYLFLRLMSLC